MANLMTDEQLIARLSADIDMWHEIEPEDRGNILDVARAIEAQARATALEQAEDLARTTATYWSDNGKPEIMHALVLCADAICALLTAPDVSVTDYGNMPPAQPIPDYRRFALAILIQSRDHLGSDIDGGMVQDVATECGLLTEHIVEESCGDGCQCFEYGFPTKCYRYSPTVLKAIAAAPADKGSHD